ncbi:MAG: hypothetical protein AAF598_09730 [Bacteroidota bacterium]
MSFEPGDVVKKKDEDQLMTVFRLLGGEESSGLEMLDNKLYNKGYTQGDPMCQWFSEDNDLQSGTFHTSELDIASAPGAVEEEQEEDLEMDDDSDFNEFDDMDDDELSLDEDASSEEEEGAEDEDDLNLDDFDF